MKDQGASGHCAAFSAVADWEAVLKRAGWEEEDYAISVGHVIASKKVGIIGKVFFALKPSP